MPQAKKKPTIKKAMADLNEARAKTKQEGRPTLPNFHGMGPRQSALIRAFANARKYPRTLDAMFNGKAYDPLGVACMVAGVKPTEIRPGLFAFAGCLGSMPPAVKQYFAFRNDRGVYKYHSGSITLTDSVRDTGIANIILAMKTYPHSYFIREA